MKKGLILGIFSSFLVSIGLASAQGFSVSEFLSFIDPTLITLAVLFVVIFAVLYFSTSKLFKGQTKIAAVISIALSLLAVYWINTAANIGNLFAGFGISNENLYTIGTILFLVLVIFLFIKLKSGVFLIIGGVFILAGVTDLVYSTDLAIIIGIVLAAIGLISVLKKKGKGKITFSGPKQNWVSRKQANANRAAEEELIKERNIAAKAKAATSKNANYENELAKQKKAAEEQQAQEQRQGQAIQNQVATYLASLRESYDKLQREYNDILRLNPRDPKVKEIYNELSAVRSEIQRVMINNKIRYKD